MLKKISKPAKRLAFASLIAACAAPVAAQSSVTLGGTIDIAVASLRDAGDDGRITALKSGGFTTSWFGFSGVEDLGGGLKAKFALGAFFGADTGTVGRFGGDSFFARDANVALAGSLGEVLLGRGLSPNFLPMVTSNPFGGSFGYSPLVLHMHIGTASFANAIAGDDGWSNEIIYSTPSFGGLTANVHYQFGEDRGNTGKSNVGANVLYGAGPLSLSAFYQHVEVNNPTDATAGPSIVKTVGALSATEQKSWMIGGGYDFGVAKVFATYGQTDHDVELEDKIYSLGVSVPLGRGKVLFGWARTEREGTGLGDPKRSTATLGYDYFLSKRTDLYAMLMNDRVTGLDNGSSIALGVRHKF